MSRLKRGWPRLSLKISGAMVAGDRQPCLLRFAVEVDQEQRQGRDALLPVNEVALGIPPADDDRAEEILLIVGLPLIVLWRWRLEFFRARLKKDIGQRSLYPLYVRSIHNGKD